MRPLCITTLWILGKMRPYRKAGGQDPQWYLRCDVVPPAKWPAVMRQCDFAFCSPGHERNTHRVVESLLQGVIPILGCPEEYELGLRGGVNCVVVRNGLWQEVLRRALQLDLHTTARMRSSVLDRARSHLFLAATRDWLHRIGVRK